MNYQEQLNQAAEKAAKEYLQAQVKEIPEMDFSDQQICEEDYKQGFLKGCEAKGKAITEALAIIDEKEQEIGDLKAKLKGLYSNSRRN